MRSSRRQRVARPIFTGVSLPCLLRLYKVVGPMESSLQASGVV